MVYWYHPILQATKLELRKFNMKRHVLCCLIFAMLLCGCDSSSLMNPDATKNTDPTTLTLQSGLVSFGEGSMQVDEAALKGTWTDPEGNILTVDSQNVVTIQRVVNGEYTVEQAQWVLDDNGLTVTDSTGGKLDYKLVEENGQIRIAGSGSVFSPVSQEESLLDQEVHYLGLGETAATDLVKLTLTGIEFAPAVSLEPGDYLLPDPSGTCAAQSGDLMACLSFRVQNLMDQGLSGQDYCNMTLEYDLDCTYCGGYYGTLQGPDTDIPAQSRADIRAVIECPETVGADNEVFLSISLTLPSSDGQVHFTYVLK